MYKTFTENKVGIDYVVGDIHGCFSRLEAFLDEILFDREVDRLFSVGDLVDRGPESKLALEYLKKDWFYAVRGNHEEIAIDYYMQQDGWCKNQSAFEQQYEREGGEWNTKGSYQDSQNFAKEFLKLPLAIEYKAHGKTYVFCHADIPECGWEETKTILKNPQNKNYDWAVKEMMWDRARIMGERLDYHEGIELCVVGHTTVDKPCVLENTLYLDTGAVYTSGYFSVLRLSDMEILKEIRKVKDEVFF